jgi:hypothetical protein
MSFALSCYYIDEPLDDDELQFVSQALIGPWAKFKTGASSLVQKRIPLLLPTPDTKGVYAESREQRAERIRPALQRTGMRADNGRQVVWVMPGDMEWDAIFQFAIREETGLAPYVAQRWFMEEGKAVRKPVRVVNTQMLIEGL